MSSSPTPSPEMLAYEKAHYNDTLAPGIYASAAISIVVPISTTALRFAARRKRKAALKSDDWLMLAATLLCIPLAFLRVYATANHTSGYHVWTVDPAKFPALIKEVIAFSFLICIDLLLVRSSILMLYLRLFPLPKFTIIVWVVQVFQASLHLIVALCFPLQCIPLKRIWDPTVPGHCLNTYLLILISASINIFFDLLVFFLPIPILLGLQATTSRKVALCSLFLMGTGVCFVSVYRAVKSHVYKSADFTWDPVILGHLNVTEAVGAIFCANAPVIYPLVAKPVSIWTSSISSFAVPYRSKGDIEGSGSGTNSSSVIRHAAKSGPAEIASGDMGKPADVEFSAVVGSDVNLDDVEALYHPQPHSIAERRIIDWSTSAKTAKPKW